MFALEHSKATYWADFLVYAAVVGALAFCIFALAPRTDRAAMLALATTGLAAWSLAEYAMHRFVLHGVEPFKTWHVKHHERPAALISAPTALSATLITLLVFIPALIASTLWSAISLTLGVTAGYLAYALCHHATHHWRANGTWLKDRKRWHALHHHRGGAECYGVTSTLWDRVFRTGPEMERPGSGLTARLINPTNLASVRANPSGASPGSEPQLDVHVLRFVALGLDRDRPEDARVLVGQRDGGSLLAGSLSRGCCRTADSAPAPVVRETD